MVLGAGGDRDRGKRPAMGAAAAAWADDVVVTDDNPRTEDPAAIRGEVEGGALRAADGRASDSSPSDRPPATLTTIDGRAAAIAHAVSLARSTVPTADNTVLVLGKGHETGQTIGTTTHAFDDRDALQAALDGLTYRPEDPA